MQPQSPLHNQTQVLLQNVSSPSSHPATISLFFSRGIELRARQKLWQGLLKHAFFVTLSSLSIEEQTAWNLLSGTPQTANIPSKILRSLTYELSGNNPNALLMPFPSKQYLLSWLIKVTERRFQMITVSWHIWNATAVLRKFWNYRLKGWVHLCFGTASGQIQNSPLSPVLASP